MILDAAGAERHARLEQALGRPELAWLLERLRARLERGSPLSGSVTLRGPTRAQRAAIDRLLGRPPSRGASLRLQLAELEEILRRADLCQSLGDGVEMLTGPVENLRAARRLRDAAWREVFRAAGEALDGRCAKARPWLAELEASGLLRRLCRDDPTQGENLLGQAIEGVGRLPAAGLPLAELAASLTGDSHALDPGTPLATVTLRAAATLGGLAHASDAEGRRDLWASVGVLCDELSAPVLALNLRPAAAASLTDRTLALHAERGEPARLTLRQLLREPPSFRRELTGSPVHVCENPAIVAAAASRLGARSAPLVCTDGQPTSAVHRLLGQLRAAGIALRYHGDFDWGGVRIANAMVQRHAAEPWRLGAADYLAACAAGSELRGKPAVPCWDPELGTAMQARRRAVHEEQVLEPLLEDLACGG